MAVSGGLEGNTPVQKPYLKWAGGKTWLIPHLRKLWQPQQELWDLFCGSLAVGLALGPRRAVCNDANPHLQNLHQQVQAGLSNDLDIHLELENSEALYYTHRTRFNAVAGDPQRNREAALLFYYLNRTGFNGLCRFNRKGEYNVPFGRYKTITYRQNFADYQATMEGWTFPVGDFGRLQPPANAFVYADPPYVATEFTAYDGNPFTWADQMRLLTFLVRHPGPVVASNRADPALVDCYRAAGFNVQQLEAPRRISCTGDRSPVLEMLASRNI